MSTSVHAAPPERCGPADGPVEQTPEYVTAQRLFDRGVVHFDSGDYESAMTLWQEAAGVLPRTYDYHVIKSELVYNVAQALDKWFEVDRDIQHLRQAKISLQNFDREIPEIYAERGAADERQRVRAKIAEIESKISAAEQADRERQLALAEAGRANLNPELIEREHRRNKAMIGAGAGLTVLGIAGLSTMGAGIAIADDAEQRARELPAIDQLSRREDQLARGDQADRLVLAGSIVGGVSLLAGVPLLITGAVFERRLTKFEKDYRLGRVELDPPRAEVGSGEATLVLRGRF